MVGCHYEPATSLRASPTVIANEVKQSRKKMTTLLCHPDPERSEGEGSLGLFAARSFALLRMTRREALRMTRG